MKSRSQRKRKTMSILLLLVMCATLLCACADTQKEEEAGQTEDNGKLIFLHYIYTDFRYRPFEYTIERMMIDEERVGILFKAEGYSQGIIDVEAEIDEAVLDDIVRIMEEENIFAWDGFRQYNTEVRDGFSFSLNARFENRSILASGYMKEPENFKAGHRRLSDCLFQLAQGFGDD